MTTEETKMGKATVTERKRSTDDAYALKWCGVLGHTHVVTCDQDPDGFGRVRRVSLEACDFGSVAKEFFELAGMNPRCYVRVSGRPHKWERRKPPFTALARKAVLTK
jgi:hypothetical protein